MEVALIGAVLALVLGLGEPDTRELVIVLPDADGRVGTVVVERGDDRIILNEAYVASRVDGEGRVSLVRLETARVQSDFGRAMTALPPRPASFYLYFVTGTDMLTEASRLELGRMREELRQRQAPDILVIGHTDRQGVDEANDELSLQRAERVKADLVSQGIAPERIRTSGRGEREPVVATEDGVDEPLNRRVEINVR